MTGAGGVTGTPICALGAGRNANGEAKGGAVN